MNKLFIALIALFSIALPIRATDCYDWAETVPEKDPVLEAFVGHLSTLLTRPLSATPQEYTTLLCKAEHQSKIGELPEELLSASHDCLSLFLSPAYSGPRIPKKARRRLRIAQCMIQAALENKQKKDEETMDLDEEWWERPTIPAPDLATEEAPVVTIHSQVPSPELAPPTEAEYGSDQEYGALWF